MWGFVVLFCCKMWRFFCGEEDFEWLYWIGGGIKRVVVEIELMWWDCVLCGGRVWRCWGGCWVY